ALNDLFVVELELYLLPIRASTKHVDFLLLREIPKAAAERYGIQHGDGASERKVSWPRNLTHNVKAQAIHLGDNHRHLRIGHDLLQRIADLAFQLYWRQSRALISPSNGSEIIPSGRTGTVFEISGSFHTLIDNTSSEPIM